MADASPLASPEPWALVADDYAVDIAPLLGEFSEEALRIAGVDVGQHVADVATGPGTLAIRAARRGAHVKAIDFAPPMIEQLHMALRDAGTLPGTVEASVGDGMALPWPDGAFDAGFSMFGLLFFPDRAGAATLRRCVAADPRRAARARPRGAGPGAARDADDRELGDRPPLDERVERRALSVER